MPSLRHLLGCFRRIPAVVSSMLAISTGNVAKGEAQVVVDRNPVVLREHVPSIANAAIPRGIDFVASDDTVSVVLYLRNTGPAQVDDVSATMVLPPGFVPESPVVNFGPLKAGAVTGRIAKLVTASVSPGSHPIHLNIAGTGYASSDTAWVAVWDADILTLDVGAGTALISGSTPFTTHRVSYVAPEVFSGSSPLYFRLESIRDTIEMVSPFYGMHWGDALIEGAAVPATVLRMGAGPAATFDVRMVVQDDDGNPLAGFFCEIKEGNNPSRVCQTDAQGRCTISEVTAGDYKVTVVPPLALTKFYPMTSRNHTIPEPPSGQHYQLTAKVPALPPQANPQPKAPPAPAQGAPPNPRVNPAPPAQPNGAKTMAVGGFTGVGLGATDAIAILGGPPGWAVTGLSALAVFGGTAAAGVAADPDGEDVTLVGERNTLPADSTERTVREIVAVDVTYLELPLLNATYSFRNAGTFKRITDQAEYAYTFSETLHVAQTLGFDVLSIDRPSRTFAILAYDSSGSLSGSEALVQIWITNPDGSTAHLQALAQDDGIAPDLVPGDGQFTYQIPPAFDLGAIRLFGLVSRTGYGATETAPSLVFEELALADIAGLDEPEFTAGGFRVHLDSPNPGRSKFAFLLDCPIDVAIVISLYDLSGRLQWRSPPTLASGNSRPRVEADTADLAGGLYFYSVRFSDPHTNRVVRRASGKVTWLK